MCVRRYTTDLLVPATNRRTQVTFEYLQALVCGVRVLAWDWVHASHASPSVPDEAFEIMVVSHLHHCTHASDVAHALDRLQCGLSGLNNDVHAGRQPHVAH